jgi:hypothetical protein
MKSPELYTILKVPLQVFCERSKKDKEYKNKKGESKTKKVEIHDFKKDVTLSNKDYEDFFVKQQYNHLFRIIKNNKKIENNMIDDVLFIDCKNHKNYMKELEGVLKDGVSINNKMYRYWGKSASMSRQGVLGLVSNEMYKIVEEHAMMEIKFDKTVLSKFEAYKCLLLSSCFCIEEEIPYMIVVPDYTNIIDKVNIKYVDEEIKTYIDKKTGEEKSFVEKVIKEGIKDIENNVNDGAGLCSIEQAKKWQVALELNYTPCAVMLRVPYIKGVTVACDFKSFYKEKGIKQIKDIWGHLHNVEDIDIILTESQYKGYKYFKINKDYSDWTRYISLLKKYNYCIGIAKYNFSHKDEPKMTRCNYQTLQTLDIQTSDLINMSEYTRRWIEKILSGDLLYVLKYLGLGEETVPDNIYMQSVLLNPQMTNDIKVRSYLYGLLRKTIDEIKIGKIYIQGAFKILIPDIVFMMEYIGGLEPIGCLKKGEMYAKEHNGTYVLDRNPHLSRSEHVLLEAKNNKLTKQWCSHLENICMINSYDITAPRLNGADKDGDLVLVHKDKNYIKGIDNNLPITLDIQDKITAKECPYDRKHITDFVKASLDSRIGEISNCASAYWNKKPKDEETKKKYEDYTCLLSVINGKEIDFVKTGIRWSVPRKIQQGVKPLPYFLKYKYKNQKKHSYVKSKMNEHCWYIEKWQRKLRFNNEFVNTSHCMINSSIDKNEDSLNNIFKEFNRIKKEYKDLKNQEKMAQNYDKYKDFFDGLSKEEVENTRYDWDKYYNKCRISLLKNIGKGIVAEQELANYMTEIIYNQLNGSYYELLWGICKDGILANLKVNRIKPILVPKEIESNGKSTGREYLGRYYEFVEYKGEL